MFDRRVAILILALPPSDFDYFDDVRVVCKVSARRFPFLVLVLQLMSVVRNRLEIDVVLFDKATLPNSGINNRCCPYPSFRVRLHSRIIKPDFLVKNGRHVPFSFNNLRKGWVGSVKAAPGRCLVLFWWCHEHVWH